MSAPAYIVTNLTSRAAVITPSTEDAAYPVSNLASGILAQPFKFTGTVGGYIEVDLGSAQAFDTVAIMGHNLVAVDSGTVKAGNSPGPSSVVADLEWRTQGIVADTGAQTARYVRVTFTDDNSEASAVGQLIIGQRVALPRPPMWGIDSGREEVDLVNSTIRGVNFVNKMFGREVINPLFRFPESEKAAFKALHTAVGGMLRPFLWLPNPETSAEVYFVRKESDFRPQFAFAATDNGVLAHWYDYRLQLTEESHGATVLE